MKKLPADFPQPPAPDAGLAKHVAWFFQVLSWLVGRAAAGDQWWIGEEETATEARSGALDRTLLIEREPMERGAGPEEAASRGEAGASRAAPAGSEAQPPEHREPGGAGAAPPPDAPSPHPTPPRPTIARTSRLSTRQPPRQPLAQEAGARSKRHRPFSRHPRPTTGPPPKTPFARRETHA